MGCSSSLSHYTGGANGWGTMVSICACCGAVVSEYNCDENGIPTDPVFDEYDTHECEFEDEE